MEDKQARMMPQKLVLFVAIVLLILEASDAGLSHKHLNTPVRRFSKHTLLIADHAITLTQNKADMMDCKF